MTPIRAQSGTAETDRQAGPAKATEPAPHAVRRGRHRKPRPRKVLLAAGGLALAAGVLSLVRVAPESGVGAPGTAEAEPRLDSGDGTNDDTSGTSAKVTETTTPRPSATTVMGGTSAAPMRTATPTTLPGSTGIPTTIPTTGTPRPTATPSTPTAPRPSPTTSTPTQAPAPAPAPTPAPSDSTHAPAPGGEVCVPVIGLCVDAPGAR